MRLHEPYWSFGACWVTFLKLLGRSNGCRVWLKASWDQAGWSWRGSLDQNQICHISHRKTSQTGYDPLFWNNVFNCSRFLNSINCTLIVKPHWPGSSSKCTMWWWYWMVQKKKKKKFDYKFFHFEERWKSHFTHPLIPCGSRRIYASTGEEMAGGV